MSLMLGTELLLAGAVRLRPQDVFATSLYTGNGGTQTITNGLDLAGRGGLVWTKARNQPYSHELTDTARGALKGLRSDSTAAENSGSDLLTFESNGFTLKSNNGLGNDNGVSYASWSFRRAKRFLDIVTYTGNGQSGRQIPHGLGLIPGAIIVKRRDTTSNWPIFIGNPASSYAGNLNTTGPLTALGASSQYGVTDTYFTPAQFDGSANIAGATYVAYLFAQNPDLIQCTSFVQQSTDTTINLGWKPQFVLWKNVSAAGPWYMADTARGWDTSATKYLRSNVSDDESIESPTYSYPTATGVVSKPNNFPTGNTIAGLFIRSPT